ncbi:hypothetical protein EC968_000041 [Mortierella alpina]|nr:hypothetical protein EC968_000041 [Mortierella alpina]
MSKSQSFRLTGTTEIVTIPIQQANGQDLVCWDAIEQVFPGVNSVKNGDVLVPHYIKHAPDEVLTVVLSDTIDHLRVESSAPSMIPTLAHNSGQTVGATDARADRSTAHSQEDNLAEGLRVTAASEKISTYDTGTHNSSIDLSILSSGLSLGNDATSKTAWSSIEALKRASKKAKKTDSQAPPQEDDSAMAHVIKLLEAAYVRQEEMKQLAEKYLQEMTKQAEKHRQEVKQFQEAADAKQETMNHLRNQAHEKQLKMEQMARNHHEEIKQLRIQALGQLAVQSRVQAVLSQTFELHEYPIPRLFIVLPQYPSGWDVLKPFTEKYRLYFLCECGEHTKAAGSDSKIPHEIHLAKHEGYEIARPTEFFQQYGPYILTILKMLKFGVSGAGVAVPAVAHLVNADALDHAAKGLQHLRKCIEPGIDQVIRSIEKDSVDEGELVKNLACQTENKEAIEVADLRKLETFLKNKNGNKVLGNLYKTVTDKGHVKWVCIDHYRENYNQKAVATLRRTVHSLGGSFDENIGLVKVKLRSRESANQLYLALRHSRSVYELDIAFDWSCHSWDLLDLERALWNPAVAILHVDVQFFHQKTMRVGQRVRIHAEISKTNSMVTTWHLADYWMGSKGAQPLAGALSALNDLDLRHDQIGDNGAQALSAALKNSALTALDLRYNRIGDNGAQALSDALMKNSTLTTLYLSGNSFGDKGAQALSEALMKNSTLTTLYLSGNSFDVNGAQALSEALKANSTLTTLDLESNLIGDKGAQALSEALKINSTLTNLNLGDSSIGGYGAQALSVALKINSTLTSLGLVNNSIGNYGAEALCEALKINSTLTSLGLVNNSIGTLGAQALSEALNMNSTLTHLYFSSNSFRCNGAQALSKAIQTNSTLTRLDLDQSSIGYRGAQALSKALTTNSTLTTLELRCNSIGDYGAQALAEALKINSTLTSLNLGDNSIGDYGAQALFEALKINSTLTHLYFSSNSIGDNGTQALSEALKTNSTLIKLELKYNSIGSHGAQALSEALKTNSTLNYLDLVGNSVGDNGAQALSEALKINSTLTNLNLGDGSIGND